MRSNWFGKKDWENIHGHEVYLKIICFEKFVRRICCDHLYVGKIPERDQSAIGIDFNNKHTYEEMCQHR
jgi:hypothetical protein